jgi:AraC-like DNA-binding protein
VGRPFKIRSVGVENASEVQLQVYQQFFKAPAMKCFKGFIVEFDEDLSAANIIGHNPDVIPTLERSAKTELALLPNPMNLVDKVIQELLKQMQGKGDFYINSIAKCLGYTVRSLQRHLQNYGTEYSSVLDFFRKENSQFLLQQGQHSVKEIASILGFKNLASFYRAYKRWYGRAPKGGSQVLRAGLGSQLTQEISARGTFVKCC